MPGRYDRQPMGPALGEAAKKLRYLRNFAAGRLVHVNMQLLYDCNLRCAICEFWKPEYRGRPRLEVEQVRVLSDKLATIGPQVISIGGGEPLLHPDLIGVVQTLANDHFPVMICNGWLVNKDNARGLFRAGIHEISVSVDYVDPQRHDAQRGVPGAHARAMRALRILQENRAYSWQRVHMISVIMNDNLDDVEPLIQMCRDIDVTYLVTLYSDNRGRIERRSIPNDVSERLLELKDRYPEFVVLRGYIGKFSDAILQDGIGPCYTGRNLCNVDSQGDVSLCIDRLEDRAGNILTDPMDEIERRLLGKHLSNQCRACWTSCRGAIETLMHGDERFGNLLDYHRMTRPVPIGPASARH